ncbi:hypothetical protein FSP39_009085 [Pinctada imbricata]|uniref:Tc1-like transposase DDE domain-containing protein n=1 Tax=Pinctada imbricata TaxID=66713 RepID=A0AA88YTB1_PINIB|nr:hypothetical protein FSP39_009085 [Pinctada imbricata]
MAAARLGRIPLHLREKIVRLISEGKSQREVHMRLRDEDAVHVSTVSICKFLGRYRRTGSCLDVRSKHPHLRILKDPHIQFIDQQMKHDPETTAADLTRLLRQRFNVLVSSSTIKRARNTLGWRCSKPKYCQMIRDANKPKRLAFATRCLRNRDNFDDCIFTDETTVKINTTARKRFYKIGEEVNAVPKPKHPLQVHVWAGISRRGATGAYTFTGNMDSAYYQEILRSKLVPFVNNTFPDSHRFVQDNDPKHVSHSTKNFMTANGINHWETPPESPDMNPIENMWAALKHHLSRYVKPKTQQELVQGIDDFWNALTPYTCNKYIDHLYKVIPKVIEKRGCASGY